MKTIIVLIFAVCLNIVFGVSTGYIAASKLPLPVAVKWIWGIGMIATVSFCVAFISAVAVATFYKP